MRVAPVTVVGPAVSDIRETFAAPSGSVHTHCDTFVIDGISGKRADSGGIGRLPMLSLEHSHDERDW